MNILEKYFCADLSDFLNPFWWCSGSILISADASMDAASSSQPVRNPQMERFGFQGAEDATPKSLESQSPATLLVRHLPDAIPHDTLLRLFSHYGAASVRPCSSGR